jgi:predicted transcriptional regulator of viral defense system
MNKEILKKIILDNDGILLTKDLKKHNIHREYLQILVKEGFIEKLAYGVYVSPACFDDEMYVIQARSDKVIFSHETALFLHDLSDRDPERLSITVPRGYNASNFRNKNIKVFEVTKKLFDLGIETTNTEFGRTIKVYNKQRTICDVVKNRNNMDIYILNEAIKQYVSSKDKNIQQLIDYSKKLRIEKKIRQYLEVLQ